MQPKKCYNLSSPLQSVSYKVLLFFPSVYENGFSGLLQASLSFKVPTDSTKIKFQGKMFTLDPSVTISGEAPVFTLKFSKPETEVKIFLSFESIFRTDYLGLFKVQDEGDVSLYSQCEPFGVDFIMPNFNYVMLKSPFKVYVLAEEYLQIFSNEALKRKIYLHEVKEKEGSFEEKIKIWSSQLNLNLETYKLNVFKTMKIVPIHLLAVAIGNFGQMKATLIAKHLKEPVGFDYNCVEILRGNDKTEEKFDYKIDLSVITPDFLMMKRKPFIEEFYFRICQVSIGFLAAIFNKEFPFKKMDLLFSPLKYNGMENPGLILMESKNLLAIEDGSFLFFNRHRMVVHELCHMYWGNLISLGEWSSMWLKEGLTEYWSRFALLETLKVMYPEHPEYEANCKKMLLILNWSTLNQNMNEGHRLVFDEEDQLEEEHFYSGLVYSKSAILFGTIGNLIGIELWLEFFRFFVKAYEKTPIHNKNFFGELFNFLEEKKSTNISQNVVCVSKNLCLVESIKEVFHSYAETTKVVSFSYSILNDENCVAFSTSDDASVFVRFAVLDPHLKLKKVFNLYIHRGMFEKQTIKIPFDILHISKGDSLVSLLDQFGFHGAIPHESQLEHFLTEEAILKVEDVMAKNSFLCGVKCFLHQFEEHQKYLTLAKDFLKSEPFSNYC